MAMSHDYQPYYCEENAIRRARLLVSRGADPDGVTVVFLFGEAGWISLARQRAAPPGQLVHWDYHVICIDESGLVHDFDTRMAWPLPIGEWVAGSLEGVAPRGRPLCLVAPLTQINADFASDRRHMRTSSGSWLKPPPAWDPIGPTARGEVHTLPAFLDPDGAGVRPVHELEDYVAVVTRSGR